MTKRRWRSGFSVLLVCLVLMTTIGVAPASARRADSDPVNVTLSVQGEGVTSEVGGATGVWRQEEATLDATVSVERAGNYNVCLRGGDGATLSCHNTWIKGQSPENFSFDSGSWGKSSGEMNLTVTVSSTNTSETDVVASENQSVFVLAKEGDIDFDGLTNQQELEEGTNVQGADTDGDGLEDGTEVTEYGTDPLLPDTDGDGLRDNVEVSLGTDPRSTDTDGDGLSDAVEHEAGLDPTVARMDTDGDGLSNERELALGTDPVSADTDGDGLDDDTELALGTNATSSLLVNVFTWTVSLMFGTLIFHQMRTHRRLVRWYRGVAPESVRQRLDPVLAVLSTAVDSVYRALWPAADQSTSSDDTDDDKTGEVPVEATGTNADDVVRSAADGAGTVDERPASETPEGVTAEAAASTASSTDSENTGEDGASPTLESDISMQTDEERVIELLERNDGQLGQSVFTERTEWSKSKVSRLLSKMDDAGEVRKISLGRKNLIVLEDEVPDAAQSPQERLEE